MITTNHEQMESLSKAAYKEFENRMVSHLLEFFPEECEELGEEEVRDEIRYGTRRAQFHGFESEQDVCRYIDLMFAFGSDFDADPDLEDLRPLLDEDAGEDDNGDAAERMDRLYDTAMALLDDEDKESTVI